MHKLKVLLPVFLFFISLNVFAGNYYCPRTNILFEPMTNDADAKGLYSTGMEGVGESFPEMQSDVGKEPTYGRLNLETKNCSTKEFECLEFIQNRNLFTKEKIFYLFMPKVIELGKEYMPSEICALSQIYLILSIRRITLENIQLFKLQFGKKLVR